MFFFDNGFKFYDIPFFNGYYVEKGSAFLRALPNHFNLAICVEYNKADEITAASVGTKVTISLNTRGGMLNVLQMNNMVYSNERVNFDSDEEFANFRMVANGKIGKSKLYRGCSPMDNQNKRAVITNNLLREAQIKSSLDLSDITSDIESFAASENFDSEFYYALFKRGGVVTLGVGLDFQSEDFANTLVSGIKEISKMQGPIYVHCLEGKDRTGFVIALLSSLMGASEEELIDDYMISYKNYYGITKKEHERYQYICYKYFYPMLQVIKGSENFYETGARAYLLNHGMTEEEISDLISLLE